MPDFEITLKTPGELAGAEEGAGELERAIGKAKALGRNFGRLERQLARVREGMRRFRLAHPEAEEMPRASFFAGASADGGRRMQNENEEDKRKGTDGMDGVDGVDKEAESGSGDTAAHSKVTADEEERAGMGDPGEVEKEGGFEGGLGQSSIPMERDPVGGDESSEGLTESRPTEVDRGLPEAGTEGDGQRRRARREVEEIAREVMADFARAQPRRENNPEEERMAALETRLRRLEERNRMNRDGGA